MAVTIVWFRNDLRIADNRALTAALRRGGSVIPLFIWAADENWQPGTASRWWLEQSLTALNEDLIARGSKLIVKTGDSLAVLRSLINQTSADAVFFSRRYEDYAIECDKNIANQLLSDGISVETFNNSLLIEPWEIANTTGKAFRVFTHYWNRGTKYLDTAAIEPLEAPATIGGAHPQVESDSFEFLSGNLSHKDIFGAEANWQSGESGAQQKLQMFLRDGIDSYAENRNRTDLEATSSLSPHLHFGEISPRQIWSAVNDSIRKSKQSAESSKAYLRQLVWREFAYHLIYHFPQTSFSPLQAKFESFPWRNDECLLQSWKEGRTGYPIVDAAMRQLRETGWINNRLRMVVASFLVKDLLLPWQEGAKWFWETLLDADLANNSLGWQWVAGCGADASPFFRIFNPVSQGQKFDPDGTYIKSWLPELRQLSTISIHKPWTAPQSELDAAGVAIGLTYPRPIVDHDLARRRALEEFRLLK